MNHIVITGESGAGKNLLGDSYMDALKILNRLVLDHNSVSVPEFIPGYQGLVLDECRSEVIISGIKLIERWLCNGVVVCVIAKSFSEIPVELLALLTDSSCTCHSANGYRHIAIGLTNQPMIEFETIPLSEPILLWQQTAKFMKPKQRQKVVSALLGEMSLAIQEIDAAPHERAAMNAKVGMLANALQTGE